MLVWTNSRYANTAMLSLLSLELDFLLWGSEIYKFHLYFKINNSCSNFSNLYNNYNNLGSKLLQL